MTSHRESTGTGPSHLLSRGHIFIAVFKGTPVETLQNNEREERAKPAGKWHADPHFSVPPHSARSSRVLSQQKCCSSANVPAVIAEVWANPEDP